MNVFRVHHHQEPFTAISNRTIRDGTLSLRALGTLVFLLSQPPKFRASAESITKGRSEGRDAVRTALNELVTAGYIRREKVQAGRGRWETVVHVFERPEDAENVLRSPSIFEPMPENPSSAPPAETSPTTGPPTTGKPTVGQPAPKSFEEEKPKKKFNTLARTTRHEDEIWDALAEVFDPQTRVERSHVGKAAKELREVGATPEQIRARAAEAWHRWQRHFSPEALLKHWSSLASTSHGSSIRSSFERYRQLYGRQSA